MDIRGLLSRSEDQRAELTRVLDEVSHEVRLRTVRDLGREELAKLFEVAADNEPLTLVDLVPAEVASLAPVIHHGKNSLPVFSHFQKRFCRPDTSEAGRSEELWGYNEQAMRPFTGPGYFVARSSSDSEVTGEPIEAGVVIDYRKVPAKPPPGWPPVRSNRGGIAHLVYGDSDDLLRKVSAFVAVGRMRKGGKLTDNWFALVREVHAMPG